MKKLTKLADPFYVIKKIKKLGKNKPKPSNTDYSSLETSVIVKSNDKEILKNSSYLEVSTDTKSNSNKILIDDDSTSVSNSYAKHIAFPFHCDKEVNASIFGSSSSKVIRTLRIRKIACVNLANVEILGKNDPFVVLHLGDSEVKTFHIDNAGDKAIFDHLDLKMDIAEEALREQEMVVSVYDHNDLRSHVLIGTSAVSVNKVFTNRGRELQFNLDIYQTNDLNIKLPLSNSKSKKCTGKVTIWLMLEYQDFGLTSSESFRLLRVLNIACTQLVNVELLGKNDPFVSLQLGSVAVQTHHIDEAGQTAIFENLTLQMEVSEYALAHETMQLSVYDHNNIRSHTLIGSCSFPIASLLDYSGEERVFSVELERKGSGQSGGKFAGKVELILFLEQKSLVGKILRKIRRYVCSCNCYQELQHSLVNNSGREFDTPVSPMHC